MRYLESARRVGLRAIEPPGVQVGAIIQGGRSCVQLGPQAITADVAEFQLLLRAADGAQSATGGRQHLTDAVGLT